MNTVLPIVPARCAEGLRKAARVGTFWALDPIDGHDLFPVDAQRFGPVMVGFLAEARGDTEIGRVRDVRIP